MVKEQVESKKVSRIKSKKKIWFKIVAPRIFGNKEVGESYLASPEVAIGRKMKINLKDLTGNVKDQNAYVGLQVIKASGSILNTAVISYELTSASIKRMVRKMTSRLDDAYVFQTKGGKKVIIKTILITLHMAQRSTESQIRKEIKEMLSAEISQTGFDNFVNNLVINKVQSQLRKRLTKIFPVKELGIKMFQLKEEGLAQEEIVVETVEDASKEEKIVEKKNYSPKVESGVEQASETEA